MIQQWRVYFFDSYIDPLTKRSFSRIVRQITLPAENCKMAIKIALAIVQNDSQKHGQHIEYEFIECVNMVGKFEMCSESITNKSEVKNDRNNSA